MKMDMGMKINLGGYIQFGDTHGTSKWDHHEIWGQ